jgi:hypothetical protein
MTAQTTQTYQIHRSYTTHHKEPRSHSAVTGTRRHIRTRLFHAGSRSSNTTVLVYYLARKRVKNEPERSGTLEVQYKHRLYKAPLQQANCLEVWLQQRR